jgi:hypothetical protein
MIWLLSHLLPPYHVSQTRQNTGRLRKIWLTGGGGGGSQMTGEGRSTRIRRQQIISGPLLREYNSLPKILFQLQKSANSLATYLLTDYAGFMRSFRFYAKKRRSVNYFYLSLCSGYCLLVLIIFYFFFNSTMLFSICRKIIGKNTV